MQQLIARSNLLAAIQQGLSEAPVVALLGARQVGKTTLARVVASGWQGTVAEFDLEDVAAREALSATPDTLLRRQEGLVVLDEVQRLPQLFEVLRPICDDPDCQAVFLLLGSASWDVIKGVSETLAGRIQFVDVAGLALTEVGTSNQDTLWMRGGFPRAFLATSAPTWVRWMRSFTSTFLERDIPMLSPRTSAEAVGRFWRMLAHYHGQVWNSSAFSHSMGVSVTAINRYRDLLSGAFMIRMLPPWFENLGKRLVKAPKIYLRDSGVLHFLLGLEESQDLPMHPGYGASWEGFGLEQTLIAHGQHQSYFYRTQRGAELDLLLVRRGRRWGFEFKCTDAPRTTKSMRIAISDLGLEHLWVVYPGSLEFPLDEKITAVPLSNVGRLRLRPRS